MTRPCRSMDKGRTYQTRTQMNIQQIREEILGLLRGTGREGIGQTIDYILGSTYFTARCHTHHHFEGGLARHSLEACRWALSHRGDVPADSVVIATLLHDLCTARSPRSSHIGGHGRRSVRILEEVCHLRLTSEEREAIRLHMHKEALTLKGNPLARIVWLSDKTSAAGLIPLRDRTAA